MSFLWSPPSYPVGVIILSVSGRWETSVSDLAKIIDVETQAQGF